MQKQRQNLKNCLTYSGASQLNFQNKKAFTKSDKRCEIKKLVNYKKLQFSEIKTKNIVKSKVEI